MYIRSSQACSLHQVDLILNVQCQQILLTKPEARFTDASGFINIIRNFYLRRAQSVRDDDIIRQNTQNVNKHITNVKITEKKYKLFCKKNIYKLIKSKKKPGQTIRVYIPPSSLHFLLFSLSFLDKITLVPVLKGMQLRWDCRYSRYCFFVMDLRLSSSISLFSFFDMWLPPQ